MAAFCQNILHLLGPKKVTSQALGFYPSYKLISKPSFEHLAIMVICEKDGMISLLLTQQVQEFLLKGLI